ncbi:MAG: crotonase/enoyl-CoA hydratase family protein [Polyangiales bacterium]
MSDIAIENGEPVLRTEVRGNVLVITLNRPHAKHAFNRALATALSDTLDQLDETPALSLAVITGGGGTFSSGQDLKALLQGDRGYTEKRGGFGIMRKPADKPLIAAVEGYAVAGGFELALSTDLIVAASDAKFGLPEVKRGLVAVGGALFRLPRRIPYHVAMEMALTGELYAAERLQALGLVSRVVEPGTALDAALALAETIAENGPLALRATKQILFQSNAWSDDEAWSEQTKLAAPAFKSEDAKEGPRAFAEKRKPVWRGT